MGLHCSERSNKKNTKRAEHLVLSETSYLPLVVILVFKVSFITLKASRDILGFNSLFNSSRARKI